MCTSTPDGFNVEPIREKLSRWVTTSPEMTIADFVQYDGAGCHARAHTSIPQRWDVAPLVVTCKTPDADFVAFVKSKLEAKTLKPRVCTYQYFTGNPMAGPASTFGMHWVLLIGTGTDSHGRDFLILFDPDVNSTERSKKKWASCDKFAGVNDTLLERLVCGKNNKLGGLIRYFYP